MQTTVFEWCPVRDVVAPPSIFLLLCVTAKQQNVHISQSHLRHNPGVEEKHEKTSSELLNNEQNIHVQSSVHRKKIYVGQKDYKAAVALKHNKKSVH